MVIGIASQHRQRQPAAHCGVRQSAFAACPKARRFQISPPEMGCREGNAGHSLRHSTSFYSYCCITTSSTRKSNTPTRVYPNFITKSCCCSRVATAPPSFSFPLFSSSLLPAHLVGCFFSLGNILSSDPPFSSSSSSPLLYSPPASSDPISPSLRPPSHATYILHCAYPHLHHQAHHIAHSPYTPRRHTLIARRTQHTGTHTHTHTHIVQANISPHRQ